MAAPRGGEPHLGIDAEARPELFVRTFEELGVTFVKLGQLISARPDLFPEAYCAAFARLTDSTTAVPFEVVARTVEEDLGADVDTCSPGSTGRPWPPPPSVRPTVRACMTGAPSS
ncbi:hypothetical protein [Micrococcus luteus]|uniref:hypothetical protein n=1 Tax=Micrococcus luteus TaxID=1270 RepID=UPI0022393DF1|nr:hypothetical protein [Micrococcus luteus]